MVGGIGGGGYALTKRKLSLGKRHFFVTEKYVEDINQDQTIVPDPGESIMKPTDPVKAELQRKTENESI